MAEKQPPSRRTQDRRSGAPRQAPPRRGDAPHQETKEPTRRSDAPRQEPTRRGDGDKQSPTRRYEVMRCENCGEDYSVTYKRCPFCDERPGRTGISGRRLAGSPEGGHPGAPHPIQVVGLVISLVLIIAALFIVFRYVGPLIFKDKGGDQSISTSQSASQSSPGASSQQPIGGASSSAGGDISIPVTPSTVASVQLSRADFTLKHNEVYQLTATVAPAGADVELVWSSSHPDVLTVDQEGIVKNINSGTSQVKATITVTAGDQSAQCVVFCRANGASTGGTTPPSTGETTSPTTPPTGTVAPNTAGTIINAGAGLNVRSGPGSTYDKVASAANGAKITILEDPGNGWYKIDYGGGKTGYVSKDYVSVGG